MTFEAGPWQVFGTDMLEKLVARCETDKKADEVDNSRLSLHADKVREISFSVLVIYILFFSKIVF